MMKHFRKDKYFRADKYFRTDKYPPKMSALLRQNLYENPPEGALSRCLAALPDPPAASVRQSLLSLLRLQMHMLPGYMYAAAAAVFLLIVPATVSEPSSLSSDFILYSGAVLAGAGLFILLHLLLAQSCGMSETERCCRCHFSYIILSRCLCLGLFLLGLCGAVWIITRIFTALPLSCTLGIFLPLAVSCAAGFGVRLIPRAGNPYSAAAAYLIASVLVSMQLSDLTARDLPAVVLLLALSVLAVTFETGIFMKRSTGYESYTF